MGRKARQGAVGPVVDGDYLELGFARVISVKKQAIAELAAIAHKLGITAV